MMNRSRSARWWILPLAGAEVTVAIVGFREILRTPEIVDIPVFTELLTSRGVPVLVLVWGLLILPSVLAMAAGAFIFIGARRETFPIWFALGMVALYLVQGGAGVGLAQAWGLSGAVVDTALWTGAALAFLLFPNGRFVPRWSGWICLIAVVPLLLDITLTRDLRRMLANTGTDIGGGRLVGVFALLSLFVFVTVAQMIRYRWVSTSTERLQTKWVLVGSVLVLFPASVGFAVNLLFPGHPTVGWLLAVTAFSSFVIPVAFAIAVTKYRLYDLGRVISRTVTYAVVVGAIGLLYVGCIAVAQLVIPQWGSLGVAASTLAAVALVTPIRDRVQRAVERRFNRARFDAQVESAAFGVRLQSALDLDELLTDVAEVLAKTLQPGVAAVWIPVTSGGSSGMPPLAAIVRNPPSG
jgi:hypothetical protein